MVKAMNPYSAIPNWLKELYPGYFTLTMATGIIAIAFDVLEMPLPSDVLYALTVVSWCLILAIYIWRALRYPGAVWDDLTNPRKTFNFFSFVAGTSVMGLLLDIHGLTALSTLSWFAAFVAWSALLYCSFGVLTLTHGERNLYIVDGGWLICIVGTQSLVLLGIKVVPHLTSGLDAFMMLGLYMLWLLGLILYGIFVTLFSYRVFFLEMGLDDYTPQMWVIMGASAISANASSGLDLADPVITVLSEVHPFVDSMALLTWAWATWWIPLLVVIGVWRHWIHKVPLAYDPRQWSIVFPLGMYTVATYQLSLAAEFEPLHQISHVMVWVAVAVWVSLIIGLFRRIGGGLFAGSELP